MAGQGVQLDLRRLLHEFLLQGIVAAHDGEGHVHPGAAILLDGALVEAVRAIDRVIEHPALLVRNLVPIWQAALLLRVLEVLAHGVEGVASRRVVHRVIVGCGLPAAVGGADLHLPFAVRKVVAQNAHSEARGTQILLHAGVDVGMLADVDGLRAEVGRHVSDERNIADIRRIVELDPVDGLVHAVVHISSLGVQLPVGLVGDRGELRRLAAARHLPRAVLSALDLRLVAPLAGD
mmetsp:Transcript_59660/g.194626  ORF Transcript_59660/g.194626 Transcript_59660/m.194626 type:complete len:235 (+) Transcript_59660:327-1031(+)